MSNIIKLNKDQEITSEKIINFIEGDENIPYFTLTGGPGTGKTVMLKETLSKTSFYSFDRSAAAVAHAAKNVICDSFGGSIPCYTVAQWLGMKMIYKDSGEIAFKKNKNTVPKLKTSKIAILDEASMINDELYNGIMQIVQDYKIKLIVVGENVADIKPL